MDLGLSPRCLQRYICGTMKIREKTGTLPRSIRLPVILAKELDDVAEKERLVKTEVIVTALRMFLEQYRRNGSEWLRSV